MKNFKIYSCQLFNLEISSCTINKLKIIHSQITKINIHNNKILLLGLSELGCNSLLISTNTIKLICVQESQRIKEVHFNIDQVDINFLNVLVHKQYINEEKLDKGIAVNALIDTVFFLKNNTDVTKNNNKWNKLLYLERLNIQENFLTKSIVFLTGGFIRPLYFILYSFITFIAFSLLYSTKIFQFNLANITTPSNGLNFCKSMYFSGITFTTIGYGDITPLGGAKALVVLEGGIGVLLTSAFLASLINKYTKS